MLMFSNKYLYLVPVVLLSLSGQVLAKSNADDSWQVAITGATLANQYVYDRGNQSIDREGTWVNPVNQTALNHVDSFQLTSAPIASSTTLTVTPPSTDTTDDCMELFYKGVQQHVPTNTPLSLVGLFPDITGPDNTAPVHLTAIPYHADDATCPMPATLPADRVLAIWDSNPTEILPNPANAIVCDLSGSLTTDSLPISQPGGCDLQKPQWSLVPITTAGTTSYYLRYSGPLAKMIADNPTKPIVIHLENDADVQFPITTQYVQYPTTLDASSATTCQSALQNYNPSDLTTFPYQACGLSSATAKFVTTSDDYQRSYTYSEPLTQPIYVTGFGRIDGTAAINYYHSSNPLSGPVDRPCHAANNWGSINSANCAIPGSDMTTLYGQGADYVRYAEWRIATSLLGLTSEYMPKDAVINPDKSIATYKGTDPAVYVAGVTVADTPIRNRGTVQLNVAQFGITGNRAANNTPVMVNDFKQLGSWMDASDGADIGSDGANEQNLYYQITDDSAKLEAKNQYLHNVTLLQGGVGGVMLGMYGVTRDGIDGSMVDGVYVPRITQPQNTAAYSAYSATHGLISTRTCPRYFQGSETDTVMPSLSNATVQNVTVFALTDHSSGAVEPNYLASMAAVGIGGDSTYCGTHFDTKNMAPDFTFGPLHLYNLQSDVTPQEPFVFYNQPGIAADGNPVSVLWNGLDFSNAPTQSAKYLASSAAGVNTYNYVCPLDSSVTMFKCMQQVGATQPVALASNAPNVTVLKPTGGPLVPYLSTTVYPSYWGDGKLATVAQLRGFGEKLEASVY